MLNTQLTHTSKFSLSSTFKSPPSLALKNYLKASGTHHTETLDSVELSDKAKSQPLKTSSLRKMANFVTLGVSLMGAAGLVGCGAGSGGSTMEAPVVVQQDSVKISQQPSELSLEREAPVKQAEQNPSLIQSEVKTVIDDVKQVGRDVKRVSAELKGADGKEVRQVLGREGQRFGKVLENEIKREVESNIETVKTIGKETKRVRENLRGKNVKEIGQELGKEGKNVGQEIGKEAKKVGQTAKKLWGSLKGKKKS